MDNNNNNTFINPQEQVGSENSAFAMPNGTTEY